MEDVLAPLRLFRLDISHEALQLRDPFLHAALVGADNFCIELLTSPRLIKLARA